MTLPALLTAMVLGVPAAVESSPAPGGIGHYAMLTCWVDKPPPFGVVDVACGPSEKVGEAAYTWWQLDVRKSDDAKDATPLVQVRALTSRHPLADATEPVRFQRYIVKVPSVAEVFEYRNVHTGQALLPGWGGFEANFVPRPARATERQAGLPNTCDYLGHVLTLRSVGKDAPWEAWNDTKVLDLDPELLVGTARGFKDKEGHRLPQTPNRQNYTYVPFTQEDCRVMIDAGFNIFWVGPEWERLIRTRPAFYIRGMGDEKSALQYPADLYRSNYLGPAMFMDEPAILMMGDPAINGMLRYFSDGVTILQKRVHNTYNSDGDYGRYALERPNAGRRINLGEMRLDQCDFPSWETRYETAWYQMAGGCNGIVHEGRYQLDEFDKRVTGFSHQNRKHTPDQLLKFHYAFLRGGTRPFGKYWGMSIYGQSDPAISPRAMTLAYDMGARYIWYWTSDHDHHLPWVEQIELSRTLRKHAAEHPRPSIVGTQPTRDLAITIPYGRVASIEDISWARILNDPGKNEHLERYERLMKRLLVAVSEAEDHNQDYDITIDDGREIAGYRKVVRINDDK